MRELGDDRAVGGQDLSAGGFGELGGATGSADAYSANSICEGYIAAKGDRRTGAANIEAPAAAFYECYITVESVRIIPCKVKSAGAAICNIGGAIKNIAG